MTRIDTLPKSGISVLNCLLYGPATAQDLQTNLCMSRRNVRYGLSALKTCGFITISGKRGRQFIYALNGTARAAQDCTVQVALHAPPIRYNLKSFLNQFLSELKEKLINSFPPTEKFAQERCAHCGGSLVEKQPSAVDPVEPPLSVKQEPAPEEPPAAIVAEADEFLAAYPQFGRPQKRWETIKRYFALRKVGVAREAIVDGARRYAKFCKAKAYKYGFAAHNFLAPEERLWMGEWRAPVEATAVIYRMPG